MKNFTTIVEAKKPKMVKVYRITNEHSSFRGEPRKYTMEGTLAELIEAYSYTLECGHSWENERGNKKINMHPKTIDALCKNLNNASNNAARNGYSGDYYSWEQIGERELIMPNPSSNVKVEENLNININEASQSELQIKGIDNDTLIEKLQDALAEEYQAWYMYTVVCPFLAGPERINTVKTYEEQAEDELEDHAAWLIERINQLGGTPTKVLSPDMWNKTATHKYIIPEGSFDVATSIAQNIEAEKGAIETYTALEAMTRDKDIVTHTKVKEILADEQEHLQNLQDLLKDIEK